MNQRIIGLILTFVILIAMPLESYAATPKETVAAQVNEVLAALADPAFKAKDRDQKISEISSIIGKIFDYDELSRRTLGREWKKMNAEQQKEFVELFKKLLQGVYADRLLAYSDQKVVFEKETMLREGQSEVESYIVLADGKRVPLFYRLTNKSGQWMVYDLVIEGVSMVMNYRSQFRDILAKDSPEKLLQILRDKTSKT
jgi:phospholipid transport system substrate-binding protein